MVATLKFCFKTCVAMKFVDDDDDGKSFVKFIHVFHNVFLSVQLGLCDMPYGRVTCQLIMIMVSLIIIS